MIVRAIDAMYAGTRDVLAQDRRDVARFIHCARHPMIRAAMRRHRRMMRQAWHQRRNPPMSGAIASYYNLGGNGACGGAAQAGYRFASLILPCRSWIRICHGATCVDAQMMDHGPYVSGRTFDLNYNLKNALGCGGICYVRWARLR